jgi:phage gpG-like protein
MNPLAFAARLVAVNAAIEHRKNEGLEKACELLEEEAKRVLGTYDYGWPPLQPETIARKTTGDSPLLETGELRDSIEHVLGHGEAWVGSNNEKALWHEFGTSRVPPRPFFQGAINAKQTEIEEVFGGIIMKAFGGRG